MTAHRLLAALGITLLCGFAPLAQSATETTVPLSAELGSSIAANLFPVTVKLPGINLRLTNPVIRFIDAQRIGMQAQVQAYDYRPAEAIAISEKGRAFVTGKPGFDPETRELLLYDPHLDTLEFDRNNTLTQRLYGEVQAAWSGQVTNPIRSALPPHPYLLPFRNYLTDLLYDGKNINLVIRYQ